MSVLSALNEEEKKRGTKQTLLNINRGSTEHCTCRLRVFFLSHEGEAYTAYFFFLAS